MPTTLPAGIRIRHDRGTVQASLWLGGRRYQRTIARLDECAALLDDPPAFKRFIDARRAAALRKLAAQAPAARTQPGRLTLLAAWQQWIDAARPRVADGTVAYYVRTGSELRAAVGDMPLPHFTARHVDAFLEFLLTPRPPSLEQRGRTRPLSKASVNIRLQNLAAFLRWAAERELHPKPPRVRQLRRERKLPRVPTDDDLRRLLRRLSTPLAGPAGRARRLHLRAFMVAAGTGLRRAEVYHLRWEQVDLAAGVIRVRFQPRFRVKELREKAPPLPPFLAAFLQAEREACPDEVYLLDDGGGRLYFAGPEILTVAFRRHYDALGIPRTRRPKAFHGFRALYATRLHNELGVDVATVQRLLGHADIAVTQGYFSRTADRERQAVQRLELPVADAND